MWRLSGALHAAVSASGVPENLVSMRFAPSFCQPPAEEVIGKSVKDISPDCVTAYVLPEVISQAEEQALLGFVNPWFARLPSNDGHLDGLIHHYKEFYRSYDDIMGILHGGSSDTVTKSPLASQAPDCKVDLPPANMEVDLSLVESALSRSRGLARTYLPAIPIDDRVHFLRLAGSGFIRAHVDESRNSSGIIGGLCLGAARVMTLTHPKHPKERVELLLAPRCFYAMIGRARYDWEHSVDWVEDDEEHISRIRQSLVVEGTPIVFDGRETSLRRHERTAIIFRGISPMQLLQYRMHGKITPSHV